MQPRLMLPFEEVLDFAMFHEKQIAEEEQKQLEIFSFFDFWLEHLTDERIEERLYLDPITEIVYEQDFVTQAHVEDFSQVVVDFIIDNNSNDKFSFKICESVPLVKEENEKYSHFNFKYSVGENGHPTITTPVPNFIVRDLGVIERMLVERLYPEQVDRYYQWRRLSLKHESPLLHYHSQVNPYALVVNDKRLQDSSITPVGVKQHTNSRRIHLTDESESAVKKREEWERYNSKSIAYQNKRGGMFETSVTRDQ